MHTICMHTHAHARTRTHMHAHAHAHADTHTHTHAHTHPSNSSLKMVVQTNVHAACLRPCAANECQVPGSCNRTAQTCSQRTNRPNGESCSRGRQCFNGTCVPSCPFGATRSTATGICGTTLFVPSRISIVCKNACCLKIDTSDTEYMHVSNVLATGSTGASRCGPVAARQPLARHIARCKIVS